MKEEQILSSAKKLFTKYGVKKVSMDEIANEAGVTKKTVYSYFSSKEELLKQLIKNELQLMKKQLEIVKKDEQDFFDSIHEAIYNLLVMRRKNDFLKSLFYEADFLKNPKLKNNLKIIETDIIEYIKTMLIDAQEKEYIYVQNIDIMTFLIYKMYIALMMEWNDNSKKLDEKEIADNILQILKNGIGRK